MCGSQSAKYRLRDKVRKSTGLDIEIDIVQHEIQINGHLRLFALILVRSTIKRSKLRTPVLCGVDFRVKENWGLRRGDIYVREGDQTKLISSAAELQNLLDDLETRYQEADMEQNSSIPSPFAVEFGQYRLLPREYETFVGRERYKDLLQEAVEGDPRIWIINLYGPGGVGKSALATWLAYEYYQERTPFDAILHLSAKDLELSTEAGIRHLDPTLFSLEDFLDRILALFEHEEYCCSDLQRRKAVASEILSVFPTLLVLDNMETVKDGRIMEFVRQLPPTSRTKVLLTSRRRTSEWEYPIQVTEFNAEEVAEFLRIRNSEMKLDLPVGDGALVEKMAEMSGGLPLAIQWILGEYATTHDLDRILSRALDPDSPLLEFSFRNSWDVLDPAAKQAFAVVSIFDEPPTAQIWRIALDWPLDKLERAINDLVEVTFIKERTEHRTGLVVYSSLPITLTFARNELEKMGDLERQVRTRYQEYKNKMDLASVETAQYKDLFERFGAETDMQKRAVMLARMAEGQARSFKYEAANDYYRQALATDPRSVYTLVSYGLFKLDLDNFGESIELMREASMRCTKQTGYYVYFSWSKVYDKLRDRANRVRCLRKALEYEPTHTIARHSLGVALSQMGKFTDALEIFEGIIQEELSKPQGPSESLLYALKTKIITLRRADRSVQAEIARQDALKMVRSTPQVRHLAYHLEEDFEGDYA